MQPGTFERVYSAIKQRLVTGSVRPGERLEPAMLSEDLNASVTPVRDALHRLAGERLIEAPRHEGFRSPQLTEAMLRHLYAWHLDILLVALSRRHSERRATSLGWQAEVHDTGIDHAFARLAAASGNPEHLAALRNLAERLGPYRSIEDRFLDAVEPETEEIIAAIRADDRKRLRKGLVRYHRRRQRIVPELLANLGERC